jgi:lipoyl(octanoyl) transferase
MDRLEVIRCGQVPYGDAEGLQRRLEGARQAGEIPDTLLLLEHPPVYTKGRRAKSEELGMGEDWYRMQGIEVAEADRGGGVTYHGPGQLVGYPIVSLAPYGDDVHTYVRRMERLMIETLGEVRIEAEVIDGLTGVWVRGKPPSAPGGEAEEALSWERRKIGSIGIHIRRGVTTHGFAINVNNDLQPFEWVVPCGIEGCRMTSVCRELGGEQDMDALMDIVSRRFGEIYEREPVDAELPERAAPVA